MDSRRTKPFPALFPGMGNPMASEIRRIEFDAARGTRAAKEEVKYE